MQSLLLQILRYGSLHGLLNIFEFLRTSWKPFSLYVEKLVLEFCFFLFHLHLGLRSFWKASFLGEIKIICYIKVTTTDTFLLLANCISRIKKKIIGNKIWHYTVYHITLKGLYCSVWKHTWFLFFGSKIL